MQESGCSFVTGGLGALGSLMGQWAAQHMTPDLRLAGRSGHYRLPVDMDKSKSALLSLQDPSSSAVFCAIRCDAGSQEECSSALSWPGLDMPLAQVMHAGGLLSDMLLGSQSMQSVRTVFAPKVDALHHLHARSWGHSVSSQLLFSSIASLLGSAGQSNYSAANAYLDTWSSAMESQGGCATSIQWGAWSGGGMALQSSSTSSRLERVGMQSLTSVEGLCVLGSILRSANDSVSAGMSLPLVAAAPISWGRFLKLMPSVPAFFSEVERDALEADGSKSVSGQTGFAAQLAKLSENERTSQIETYLTGVVGDVLGREVGGDEPLLDAGLDSLGAVELHNTVQQSMGVELPTTLVFDYPNINAVSSYISGEIKTIESDLRGITNLSYDFDSSIAELMEYMDELPKDTVLDVLEKTSVFSGIDKLRQSDDLYNFIMPGILCDSKLCLSYRPKNKKPLPMPIMCLYGESDTTLGYNDVLSWQHYTSHVYKIFKMDGDHFFINTIAAKLKSIHLVADHLVGIHDQFVKEKAVQKHVPRIQNVAASSYQSDSMLSESTPIVLLISPGLSEEDVVQIRSFMTWTSRGVYTLSGSTDKPVAQLAAEYLFQVLSMKLQGPFIIMGWSAGAIVAYDLAVKLEQQSYFVEKLVLMDGLHPVQLRDFGACAQLPFEEKAEFVMQRVLQRHYMWPRFSKTWPDMTPDQRMEEFLEIYSAIIGRDFGKDLFHESIEYMESWWNFGALRPQEYNVTSKLERGTLLYFRPMVRGGLPLVDDLFNIDFHHVIGWHEHCNNFQIVDVPGDHFTMLPSAKFENLPFWRTVFKTFVEWHHNEGGILQDRLRAFLPGKNGKGKYGKKKKLLLRPAPAPAGEDQAPKSTILGCIPAQNGGDVSGDGGGGKTTVLGCIPVAQPKWMKKMAAHANGNGRPEASSSGESTSETVDEELDYESEEALRWLRARMAEGDVSQEDQDILQEFLGTIDKKLVVELVGELKAADQVLSIETLTSLPERAQEILAEALGINQSSISRMARLSNRTRTLRIVIKSFLKTRK
ncbi:polyketide synthase [Chloropicon primus]|uniref:Polyketide synthase n=2 Tax=Chloropicon primus TaxID=1764295 RepID=A0A5B8MQ41_9CHLO|nr:polyketide synthase [Chloropicon primus]|eukprot:QDZ22808.1 polyketide synthase [Chloropicon primus]